jgi:hypothetical protein
VTIPEGGDAYSEPLTLPFPVTPGHNLLLSLYLQNSAVPYLPTHSWASGATEWITAPGSGNAAGDATGTPFTGAGSAWTAATNIVTSLDVTTPQTPTIPVLGNNLTDPSASGNHAIADLGAPSIRVAGQLASGGTAAGYSPVDEGIQANQLISDGQAGGGVSVLARVDRDVLSQPNVGTAVVDAGLEDLLQAGNSTTVVQKLEDAYLALAGQLNAFGVNAIIATLTPCHGYSQPGDPCTTTVDANRVALNTNLITGSQISVPNCVADFSAAVAAVPGASPEQLASAAPPGVFDAGDHVNLTAAGYAALAAAVTGGCALTANTKPLPLPPPPPPPLPGVP